MCKLLLMAPIYRRPERWAACIARICCFAFCGRSGTISADELQRFVAPAVPPTLRTAGVQPAAAAAEPAACGQLSAVAVAAAEDGQQQLLLQSVQQQQQQQQQQQHWQPESAIDRMRR